MSLLSREAKPEMMGTRFSTFFLVMLTYEAEIMSKPTGIYPVLGRKAYAPDQTSSNEAGRPMAPNGTVTTSRASAGQKTSGRTLENGNGNGKSQKQGIPRRGVSRLVVGKPPAVYQSEVIRSLVGSGAPMTTAEVRFCYTDFFDTSNDAAAPYFEHAFSTVGSLISNNALTRPARRIIGADLWALPKFDLETSGSSFIFLSTCPVSQGGRDAASSTAGNIQNTVVLPKSDAQWVKVGSWRSNKLFADSNITPAVNSNGDQAIFSGCVLDPDTLDPVGAQIQCKICVYFAENVPAVSQLKFTQSNGNNAAVLSDVTSTASTLQDTLLSVTGMSNSL